MTAPPRGPVVLAVDFGTTNTVGVARWRHLQPRRVTVDGDPSMPSAVLLGQDGSLIVGKDAVRLGRSGAARLELRPKSRLDEETILLGDQVLDVLDVVRAVLRRLCTEVADQAGSPVDHLVVTHPADWGAVRLGRFVRATTGLAARVSLVPEPVAAAAQAGMARGATRAVLDFGGGTCDAAVVRADVHGYSVLACAGLPDLGGDDLDQRVVDSVLAGSPAAAGRLGSKSSTQDIHTLRDRLLLSQDARAAKELLSRHDSARVAVPGLAEPVVVHREDFERVVAADLDRAAALILDVVGSAGMTPAEVGQVLLVGGSSRIPALGELLRGRLGVRVDIAGEPESAVAFGALAVTGSEEQTVAHPVVLAGTAVPVGVDAVPSVDDGPGVTVVRRRRFVVPAALAAVVVAVLVAVWLVPWGDEITGSPAPSSPSSTAVPGGPPGDPTFEPPRPGGAVTGPDLPRLRVVPQGQSGSFHAQSESDVEVRVDRIAVITAVPSPTGYRLVQADVTVTHVSGLSSDSKLVDATPMRLADDRGQRMAPLRSGPAVDAGGCGRPLPTVAVGQSRQECQVFLVPNATPVVGVTYDDFAGGQVNRGGFVLSAELAAAGTTGLPGVVGEIGGPAEQVRLDHGQFRIRMVDVIEKPSAHLTENSRPGNGGRYVIVRMVVTPSGGATFRDLDFTLMRLLDDRGLVVPEEHLTPAELVDCPQGRSVPPGESAAACVVFTIGAKTPVGGVGYVGQDHDVASWRTWRLAR